MKTCLLCHRELLPRHAGIPLCWFCQTPLTRREYARLRARHADVATLPAWLEEIARRRFACFKCGRPGAASLLDGGTLRLTCRACAHPHRAAPAIQRVELAPHVSQYRQWAYLHRGDARAWGESLIPLVQPIQLGWLVATAGLSEPSGLSFLSELLGGRVPERTAKMGRLLVGPAIRRG